jgi:hypothetical protein
MGRWDQNGSWRDWPGGGGWIRFDWLRIWTVARSCEHGDVSLGPGATELVRIARED